MRAAQQREAPVELDHEDDVAHVAEDDRGHPGQDLRGAPQDAGPGRPAELGQIDAAGHTDDPGQDRPPRTR